MSVVANKRVLGFVMAGGKGTRLMPLTAERSKPSVPFGGKYRIIDFVLSNLINSGIYSIYVLTQFKSQSLNEHLMAAWSFGSMLPEHFVHPVPAQQRHGEHWYRGTADCIYQNSNLISDRNPGLVAIFGGDHIFLMNVAHMIEYTNEKEADVSIACIPHPIEQAHRFGVVQVDEDWRITGFQEKPKDPAPIPGHPDQALVSMGNYIFKTDVLQPALDHDAQLPGSSHDFGKDILPGLLTEGRRLFAYDFSRNYIPNSATDSNDAYWRDVGDLDAYYDASMDLRSVHPQLDLYNSEWPLRSAITNYPPAKFVHNVEGRVGHAIQSIVCEGSIVSGATVRDSLVGMDCRINSFAEVDQCVLMDDIEVGRGARLCRCIVDKHVCIPPGARIGYDHDEDRKHFHITPNGIVVVSKSQHIPPPPPAADSGEEPDVPTQDAS